MKKTIRKTGFIYSPRFLEHDTGRTHPENTGRLKSIMEKLSYEKILDRLLPTPPLRASIEQISLVHDPLYIRSVAQACERGETNLDADTIICPESYEVALLAAGGVISAVDALFDNKIENAFCCVRPPGHHAESNSAQGFCLFNNIAIGAKYALQTYPVKKIFIIDWDLHHGNGTQNSFYDNPQVFYASLHQYPHYPGTGSRQETGIGKGEGYTLNFPLPAGQSDTEYIKIFTENIIPALENFKPELIMISAGFDAHQDDPLGGMQLTSKGFGKLTSLVCNAAETLCQGKIISVLEGGYDYNALAESVFFHLQELLDIPYEK